MLTELKSGSEEAALELKEIFNLDEKDWDLWLQGVENNPTGVHREVALVLIAKGLETGSIGDVICKIKRKQYGLDKRY
jgi:hypothetical protein